LSISDRNDGELPGRFDRYPSLLAHACHSTPTKVRVALAWLTVPRGKRNLPWVTVESDGIARVTNHSKYHAMQEGKKIPQGNANLSLPSEPSEPSYPNPPIPPSKKAASPNGFAEFWNLYPKKKSKGDAEKAWSRLKPDSELQVKILAGIRRGKSSQDWFKQSGQFIPYPATWLRAKGWEDQVISFSVVKKNRSNDPMPREEKLTPEQIEKNRCLLNETITNLAGKMSVER